MCSDIQKKKGASLQRKERAFVRTLESINQNTTTTSSIMSASSKAAERDPLLPYARQFGSIRENEDENDDGKRFERRGASSDDVENGRKKTFFLFDHGGAHSSREDRKSVV